MLQERLQRRDGDDVIYIGELARSILNGESGELLTSIIRGRQNRELNDRGQNADRILGRMEAYETLIDDLETCIQEGVSEQERRIHEADLEKDEKRIMDGLDPQEYRGRGTI